MTIRLKTNSNRKLAALPISKLKTQMEEKHFSRKLVVG
jgi:hypothetical protein